ncbi:hypothetical protein AYL99_09076 [Fonsecaea erecta]|uniref:FAD dependent oxidoreductase domain-containing protein n=1 Tax=Fonsecaea erecta TaxID=1367422 RepID=A0A178ZB02_9EURO|nr:hypothetical protein AYL99_09076 [Fonsecaea erecta]OAP56964.1 hypothetical protein AYL99_09076 [Fonsecaea erecta]
MNYQRGGSMNAMEFDNLVISAGPWSPRVLSTLFPWSEISIPFDLAHAAGNHLLVRAPRWKPEDDEDGCDQLYLAGILNRTLDISSYLGGTFYVGGYDGFVYQNLDIARGEALEVISVGRCYRPMVEMRHPVITQLPLEQLMGPQKVPSNIKGSFYLNTGHGSDGITLGPGSGKVMSDLIAGRKPAVDISRLGLTE